MKKIAILFGINEYPDCPLKNAVNDATALSQKLQELGFETTCKLDIDSAEMDRALVSFKTELEGATVGLFFFAGHGIQCKGENFLGTISTSFFDESSCKYTAISLNRVIDIFEESNVNTKIIILDACRDNPFIKWRSAAGDGLAPVCAPKGTIIAFSTSPGQKSSDGVDNHGVYTKALLAHIGTKNVPIEDMFKRVRNTVSSYTGHKQITWEHTSLMGTFFFNSGIDGEEAKTTYIESALADHQYTFTGNDDIESIVDSLKTYNWYKQNPAIKRIGAVDFTHADKDDVFVLGRNIYQTACGGSGNAIEWIDHLESNLIQIGGAAAVHLLNGILFEIYFDSNGQMRKSLKSEYYEKPVKLCLKEKFKQCGLFVQGCLEQYPQRIVYIPGSQEIMTIDVLVSQSDGQYHINGICVDGLNCMYDESETEFYEFDETSYYYQEMTPADLERTIIDKIGAPQNKVKITFSQHIDIGSSILVPTRFSLLRYIL